MDAGAAWEARKSLNRWAELIDEPHFHVMVLTCSECAQRFVSVFTEMIDWKDGDDPQYWTLMPIIDAEYASLSLEGGNLTEAKLEALGNGRRCLRHDHPKGTDPYSYWGSGIVVGMHD